MNLSDVWTVFRKDWLQTIRDRNTLLIMVVSVLMLPVLSTLSAVIVQRYGEKVATKSAHVAIYGADAEWLRGLIAGHPRLTAQVESTKENEHDAIRRATARGAILLVLPPDFRSAIQEKRIAPPTLKMFVDNRRDNLAERLLVGEALRDAQTAMRRAQVQGDSSAADSVFKNIGASNDKAPGRAERDGTVATTNHKGTAATTKHGESISTIEHSVNGEGYDPDIRSLASSADRTGVALGLMLPIELTLAALLLSLYSATELITTERERNTLILLAVSPPSRRDILLGKTLVVLATVLIGCTLSMVAQIGLFSTFIHSFSDMSGSFRFILPLKGCLAVIPLALPLAIFLTGSSICVGAYARNFQQAQSYASVLLLICMVPAVASLLSTSDFPPLVAVVPIASTALAIRDALSNQLSPGFAAAVMISSCAYATLSLWLATRLLDSEHSVFPQDEPLGAWRTSSRFLTIFLGGVFLAYFVIGQNMQSIDVLYGLIASQALIIALPVAFFLSWLRLNAREVLSLRMPTSLLSIPGAIFCAPLTVLVASSIMQLQDFVLPMPKSLNEMMMQVLLPPGKPLWLELLAVAVAPAICEELLFRGCVQGILIRSLPPRVVLPITAFGFGLFHMSTFRVLPTSALGLALCYLTYRYRSIYPAMILHLCHNSLSVILGVYQINPLEPRNVIAGLFCGGIGFLLLSKSSRAAK